MSDKTAEEILPLIASEFENDSRIEFFVKLAELQVGKFPDNIRPSAVAYMAAHLITMSDRQGSGGAVTSKSEGALSVSFAADSANLLHQTSYGMEFSRLSKMFFFLPRTSFKSKLR